MRIRGATYSLSAVCIAVAMLAGGCLFSPRPDRSKYFVLSPEAAHGAALVPSSTGAANQLIVGLGPIKLPEYLDRPEVVTRVAPNRLELSPTDRWAEPLSSDFRQVIAQDLSAGLGTQMIIFYPWYRTTRIDYQVTLDVYRFERDSHGTVTLVAHWQVFDGSGAIRYATDSTITETAGSGEPGAAALSRAVGSLAAQISSSIESLRSASPAHHA